MGHLPLRPCIPASERSTPLATVLQTRNLAWGYFCWFVVHLSSDGPTLRRNVTDNRFGNLEQQGTKPRVGDPPQLLSELWNHERNYDDGVRPGD
jgi:hypothetical protein